MNSYSLVRIALVLTALLFLRPPSAYAKFLIEFADGHRMTVNNYEESGDTVRVHTSLGSFAFQKNDIVKVTDLDPGKKGKKPVTTAKAPVVPAPTPEKKPQTEPTPVERPAKAPASPARQSSPLEDVATQIEDGLYRMRYVFALVAGAKALKIFFAASAR